MNRMLEQRTGRVLAIGAHPDVVELGAGGLLARLSAEGSDVTMAIVAIPDQLERRRGEAAAAAEVIDAELCVLFEDAPLRVDEIALPEIALRLERVIGRVRPDLVITHSARDLRDEHGLVHRATVAALRGWPCDLLAYRSGEPVAAAPGAGTCFADITDHVAAKLVAIGCHTSQLARLDLASSRDLARSMGRYGGYPYAEAYEVVRVRI